MLGSFFVVLALIGVAVVSLLYDDITNTGSNNVRVQTNKGKRTTKAKVRTKKTKSRTGK